MTVASYICECTLLGSICKVLRIRHGENYFTATQEPMSSVHVFRCYDAPSYDTYPNFYSFLREFDGQKLIGKICPKLPFVTT